MRFIELTDVVTGKLFFVNVANIVSIKKSKDASVIIFDAEFVQTVKETVDEIMVKIRG